MTFVFKKIPTGLCNTPIFVQRYMIFVFSDMVKDTIEMFIYDFSIVRDSFDDCLAYLANAFHRFEECNLVLNLEKCHFMVKKVL